MVADIYCNSFFMGRVTVNGSTLEVTDADGAPDPKQNALIATFNYLGHFKERLGRHMRETKLYDPRIVEAAFRAAAPEKQWGGLTIKLVG